MTENKPAPVRLILVRHGETACNKENVWHGWDECELTPRGLEQARAAGLRLAREPISAIYTSPTRRALQTAQAIARQHNLTPVVDERLRERNAGDFEGVLVADVASRHPTIWEERSADFWGWRPPGGETFREVLERSLAVVERVRAQHAGETVAIVCHMGPVRVLVSHFLGIPLSTTYEMTFPSTGVTILTLDGDTAHLETMNDAAHVGT